MKHFTKGSKQPLAILQLGNLWCIVRYVIWPHHTVTALAVDHFLHATSLSGGTIIKVMSIFPLQGLRDPNLYAVMGLQHLLVTGNCTQVKMCPNFIFKLFSAPSVCSEPQYLTHTHTRSVFMGKFKCLMKFKTRAVTWSILDHLLPPIAHIA